MSLLEDLKAAVESPNAGCPLCRRIAAEEDQATKDWLTTNSAGTIGTKKLAAAFRVVGLSDPSSGSPIGRRTIVRHREEEHIPS